MTKKAFEVACALIRIAGYSGNVSYKSYLESYAMALLDSVETGNNTKTAQITQTVRQFLLLGTFSGFLTETDRSFMQDQIATLNAAIYAANKESGNPAKDLQLQDIFTESGNPETGNPATLSKPAKSERTTRVHKIESDSNSLRERQERILEIIRQSGNCKVRDLQDKLPDISERTLRYDIQTLAEQGKIERFGPGGPSTFYRLKSGPIETQESAQTSVSGPQVEARSSALWLDA